MDELNSEMIPEANESILSRTNLDGCIALMSLDDDDNFYKIDGMATKIWEKIDGEKNIKTILDEILISENLPKEKFVQDSLNFLKELTEEKIITFKS